MSRDHQQSKEAVANMVALLGRSETVYLPSSKANQRFHCRWWTALPAIPANRDVPAYRRLSRHFADHTMNTFKTNGVAVTPGSRGFYVEGREDHLVPAFFENFTLFSNSRWLEQLLTRLDVPCEGRVQNLAWSYSYEEVLAGERRPRIADVVIMWRDDRGDAVLVIEAKRPGCGPNAVGPKDDPANGYYLHYREMRTIDRRYQALLIDERDRRYLNNEMLVRPSVFTWQELVNIQRGSLDTLNVPQKIRDVLLARLDAHYSALGLTTSLSTSHVNTQISARTYEEFQALDAPDCVKGWLIGSELFFGARHSDNVIQPPYEWLKEELTITDYVRAKRQSTRDRQLPIWRI